MADSFTLSKQGYQLLKEKIEEKELTQEQLAANLDCSLATVKRLLDFQAVLRKNFIKLGEFLEVEWETLIKSANPYMKSPKATRFSSIFWNTINDKTQNFVGRDFVFNKFDDFKEKCSKGYFIVTGDPGQGKSSIAAKYVKDTECIHFFNNWQVGPYRAREFLEHSCKQLIETFPLSKNSLPSGATDNGFFFATLLQEISTYIAQKNWLVIVVDALDEVRLEYQDSGTNPLYLPSNLPPNIFFFITSRRGTNLYIEDTCPSHFLNLLDYNDDSLQDIEAYIWQYLAKSPDASQLKIRLRSRHVKEDEFVNIVAKKSECNFMYLTYILPQLATGFYKNIEDIEDLNELPSGLEGYYNAHWSRMGITDGTPNKTDLNIIYILADLENPVPTSLISKFASMDKAMELDLVEVQSVLNRWEPFLHKEKIAGEWCYSLYHKSFQDFLYRKDIVEQAGVQLSKIHGRIEDVYFSMGPSTWHEEEGDEDEDE